GGEGRVLTAALTYSNVVFAGALGFWLFNILASVVRGTGNMLLPAALVIGGGVVTPTVPPTLNLRLVPPTVPGSAGRSVAVITYYSLGTVVLLVYLCSGKSLVQLAMAGIRLQSPMFWEILRVGIPGSLNTVLTNLNVALLTSLVGPFGTFALAGYGLGARL